MNLSLPVNQKKVEMKLSAGGEGTYMAVSEPTEVEMEMMPNSAYVPRSAVHDDA